MDIYKLNKFNDWWVSGHPRPELLRPYHRPVFNRIISYMDDREILLLYGMRRIGKTTLMYQIIDHLISTGINNRKILYFTFDETEASIDDLISTYESEVIRSPIKDAGRVFLFLDEIQKNKDWENKVKIYYDLYPNVKFIISGSASVNVKKRSSETLAGRLYSFYISQLEFKEFLEMKGIAVEFENWKLYENNVRPRLMDYLIKGGFPELVSESSDEKVLSYVRDIVLDRILLKDIPEEFGIRDIPLLRTLLGLIASEPGFIINYDSLSKKLGRSKQTIMNYIFFLEYSLIVKTVENTRPGFLATSRKMRKVYLTSSGFVFAISGTPYTNNGKIAESAVVQAISPVNYYREGNKEIDFIWIRGNLVIPIEVKYGNYDVKNFISIIKGLNLKKGIIVSRDKFEKYEESGFIIGVIPLWLFILFPEKIDEDFGIFSN